MYCKSEMTEWVKNLEKTKNQNILFDFDAIIFILAFLIQPDITRYLDLRLQIVNGEFVTFLQLVDIQHFNSFTFSEEMFENYNWFVTEMLQKLQILFELSVGGLSK